MEHKHLSATEIAGFIDRTLDEEVRVHAIEHLAACERCRDEVAACVRLAATVPPKRRTSFVLRAVAAVAAVLVLAVALRSTWRRPTPVDDRSVALERSAPMASRVTTVFPSDSMQIARSRLAFTWKRDAGAVTYSLRLIDANGKLVYSNDEIADTTFRLPDTVQLEPSAVYFWHVDAPHKDGSSAQSNSASFRVTP